MKKQDTEAPTLTSCAVAFDKLPDSARVRPQDLCQLFNRHRQTIWRYVRDGHLPPPHRLFGGHPTWSVGEIRKALRAAK
ncbi:MAG: transcriptional regulator [Betaproteobacteria bacterium]|nr:transcriptional regulator [Betaproteobacteria bacterium]